MAALQSQLMTTSGPRRTWPTSRDGRTEHAATEPGFDAGRSHSGEIEAMCGTEFGSAPMAIGPVSAELTVLLLPHGTAVDE
jgi:hypothetical protein